MVLGTQTHKQSQQTMVSAMMEEVGELCEPRKAASHWVCGVGTTEKGKARRLFVRVGTEVGG